MRLNDLLPYAVAVPVGVFVGNLWARLKVLEERINICFASMQRVTSATEESAKLLRIMREEVRQLVDDDDDEDE